MHQQQTLINSKINLLSAQVFEGDSSFLTAIMESLDRLYAAAASLDIQLQLFCSYSSELTDEIIMNSIRSASKLNQGLYPAMLELETFAESFLTRFPSINPISAHAILSSGGTLVEFLECPHDQQIQAIGKYHVPNESMVLFSSLCRYGELGESKSGMTDCSSAVSSTIDSDNCSSEMQSHRNKKKYTMATRSVDNPSEDRFGFEPLNGFDDFSQKLSRSSRPHELRNLSTDYSHNYSLTDQVLYEKQDADTLMNDINWDDVKMSENVCEDFRDEALQNSSLFSGDDLCITINRSWAAPQTAKEGAVRNPVPTERSSFGTASHPIFPISAEIDSDNFCIANSSSWETPLTVKEGAVRNHVHTKRPSFDTSCHPVFPISTEIDSDSEIWFSLRGQRQRLDGIFGNPNSESSMELLSMKKRDIFMENKMQKTSRNTLGLSCRETATPYGETPPSTPIRTSVLQQGSPWMTEFLNRIKEKSRMHQQSISCSACVEHSASSRKIYKVVNRQSPSSLDSYRYQGGIKAKKATQQKWPKQFRSPLDSVKHEKRALSFSPTWTPVDKRARQVCCNGSL